MGDPVTLVESTKPPVVTTESEDGAKPQVANKNGKKADSGSGGSGFFTWFMVLALLGVWTSVAVVYFDLVDYQGVLDKAKDLQINLSEALQGKLVAYDTDGDGDFDVEDAKVLLAELGGVREEKKKESRRDEKPGDVSRRGAKKENPLTKDVGWKLREALKQQLAIIHERVEAKKIAKLALAEVRQLLAKEDEEKAFESRRDELSARAKERVAARLKEEEEKIEREEMEKALEKLRREKAKQQGSTMEEEEEEKVGEKKSKKGGEKEKKADEEGRKAEEDKGKGKELVKERGKGKELVKEKGRRKEVVKEKDKKGKAEKSDKGGRK